MKKTTLLLTLFMAAITGLQSCKHPQEEKKFLTSVNHAKNQPVNYEMASACVAAYEKNTSELKKTYHISFISEPLKDWIVDLEKKTTYDELRVCFGMYTREILARYKPNEIGLTDRVTVFIFPFNNGKAAVKDKQLPKEDEPVDPYNMGEIHPK